MTGFDEEADQDLNDDENLKSIALSAAAALAGLASVIKDPLVDVTWSFVSNIL